MRRKRGFTLIELMVVVAIILIISAIAIPNLLRARVSANEASAVGSLRAINTAEVSYESTYPAYGFACTLDALGPAANGTTDAAHAGLLDSTLATTHAKSGYVFAISNCTAGGSGNAPAERYSVVATPQSLNKTGIRSFCSDESGVLRYAPEGSNCNSSSPTL